MYESMGRHDDERKKFSRDSTPSLPLQAKAGTIETNPGDGCP